MKRTLALVLSLLMVLMCVPVYAIDFDAPEATDENIEIVSASLAEPETLDDFSTTDPTKGTLIWYKNFEDEVLAETPGSKINNAWWVSPDYVDPNYQSPYQYSTSSLTLEDLKFTFSGIGGATTREDPLDSTNKVLRLTKATTGANSYALITFYADDQLLSKPGEYLVEFDCYLPTDTELKEVNLSYYGNGSGTHVWESFTTTANVPALVKGEWCHLARTKEKTIVTKEDVEAAGYTWSNSDASINKYGTTTVASPKAYLDRIIIYNGQGTAISSTQKGQWYMDNIKIWYKEYADITFRLDTLPAAAQGIAALNFGSAHRSIAPGEALPTLDLTGTGYEFAGWSKTQGGAVNATTATAGAQDLFPVYTSTAGVQFHCTNNYVAAGTATEVIVSLAGIAAKSWNVDLGNTDATYVNNTSNIAITTGNKAGKITVTCIDNDNDSHVAEIVVYKSTVVTPGLNMFNGLPTPVDFEDGYTYGIYGDGTQEVVDLAAVTSSTGGSVSVDSGNNVSGNVLKLSSDYALQYFKVYYDIPFETGRPYWFSTYLYKNTDMTETTGNWFLHYYGNNVHWQATSSGFSAAKFYRYSGIVGPTSGDNAHTTNTSAIHHQMKAINSGTTSTFALYLDQLTVVPAYKVTYVNGNGDLLKTEYLLLDSVGHLVTEFVPDVDDGLVATIDGVAYDAENPYTLEYKDFTVVVDVPADSITFIGEGGMKVLKATSSFTVPTAAEAGVATKNFINWVDENGNKVPAGSTINALALAGTTVTAFYQDASVPAMGFAYEAGGANEYNLREGNSTHSQSGGYGTIAMEDTVDAYGRNVTNFYGTPTGNDNRLIIYPSTTNAPKASEYYIFSVEQMTYSLGSLDSTSSHLFFIPTGSTYRHQTNSTWITHQINDTETVVAGEEQTFIFNIPQVGYKKENEANPYTEEQMAPYVFGPAAANYSQPDWTISQFWYDYTAKSQNQEIDVDIINARLYRGGITEVNYYNGSELLFTDSDRGVGTGYLLRSTVLDAPDGLIFAGWADEDGNIYQGNKLDLTGDTNVYAVFSEPVTLTYYANDIMINELTDLPDGTVQNIDDTIVPEIDGFTFVGWMDYDGNVLDGTVLLDGDTDIFARFVSAPETDTVNFSLRAPAADTNGFAALRFKGTVAKLTKSALQEYGFLISTAARLNGADLTTDLAAADYVKGAAYIKGVNDYVFAETVDEVTFTAACFGIPAGYYNVDLYARSYAIYNTADGGKVTLYGATATQNLRAQAQKYKNAASGTEAAQFYTANKAVIDAIIANAAN